MIRGIPVVGAAEVSDYAFLECAWTLDHMLHERSLALSALVAAKVRVGIIGVQQYTMDSGEQHTDRGISHRRRPGGMIKLRTSARSALIAHCQRVLSIRAAAMLSHGPAQLIHVAIRPPDGSGYVQLVSAAFIVA